MRCRSTKEAGELVSRVLGEHDHRLDHAAIAMVRSAWWTRAPKYSPNEPRGERRRAAWLNGHLVSVQADTIWGEIPWR